ncbi:MAG TPA: type I restriction enzyme HsdR N-terminal domain-containing protein [Gemmatimonadales bacterium]|nr:type I restriction enzyme HsdR N-terminal domain-containing protein [Bradyrhizobium sp.]HXO85208.1 type I restriction enzyme HsdR N-terminal domain-containing protein [Gemmatimonadales bacterium]
MAAADIRRPLKKFLPHLVQAKTENLNEADTVMRVIKVFEDVLGYSAMSEITRESNIKDKYVDLAIKIDGTIRLLVEVKSAGTVLRDRHIEQAERYAAEGNYRWVVLTNGTTWNLYHLTFEEGIEYERLFSVDISNEDDFDKGANCLALIHRTSVRKDEHDEHWARRLAMNAASIGKALFSEEVLRFIRRDIRKREGLLVDEEDLATAIHDMLSADAREQMGPMRIRRRRKPAKKGTGPETAGETAKRDDVEAV